MPASDLPLSVQDPEVWTAISAEQQRQDSHIELVASENYASRAVMAAQGSPLTNKYAEGYPGKRYYGGCEHVDEIEQLALDRVKKLFGARFANVQPNSGSQANQAVYLALLEPGDTVLGMSLSHGGHLTHGAPVNMSGRWFRSVHYGLDDNEVLDYDQMERLAHLTRPKLIIAGASAYGLHIDFGRFARVAQDVGAYLMVDMAHYAGLVAAGLYPNPLPHAHVVTATTHKSLRGPRGGVVLTNDEDIARRIDQAVFPGLQGGPLMHVIAAKAVAFAEALRPEFRKYQACVLSNAQVLASGLVERGFKLVSSATQTHLMLVDLRKSSLTGLQAQHLLAEAKITCNRNSVPDDPRKPSVTSGLRLGTPAVTTRGFGTSEMRMVADMVADVLSYSFDDKVRSRARRKAEELTELFPVHYRHLS